MESSKNQEDEQAEKNLLELADIGTDKLIEEIKANKKAKRGSKRAYFQKD